MMDWPRLTAWGLILAASVAFWAAACTVAKAAPIEPVAPDPLVAVTEAEVQPIIDATAAWMADTLKADVPSHPVVLTDAMVRLENAGEYRRTVEGVVTIALRPWVAEHLYYRLSSPTRHRGRIISPGVHVLIHELAHRGMACEDEGIVDAITADLAPAWGWRFWRDRITVVPYYPGTAAIRYASARATGSKTWRTRDARLWRRALWGASCEGREAMLREAT